MSDGLEPLKPPRRSSRQRHLDFVREYREDRLDVVDGEKADPSGKAAHADADDGSRGRRRLLRGKRKEYAREYLRWLQPHRFAVVAFFVIALLVAALQMIEPLFMRFMVDRVLLNPRLD